ncbi:MAG: NAD(P)/FAD-dependent oxidoreductase [Nocardioidaceae bacterium]|nr:NAD(P)/FAD-dependent oxidoreductase [Nocardioidaceae bacterium]
MRETWDVLVVGAGPAGASAALGTLAARPRARVLLLDRADFPRDKSCGDGIAPHVLDALAPVGAADVVAGWAPVHRLSLRRGGAVVDRDMRRPAYVVPREVFDARLVERAVAAGATLLRHKVREVAVRSDRVEVDGYAAAVVVGADGAHSVVRPRPKGRRALAIRGYTPTRPEWAGRQLIVYGERRQPSYAWAFDRGDGLTNVGYGEIVDDARPVSRDVLLGELADLLPGSVSHGRAWRAHHLPLSGWRWAQPDGRVLLAGDAAGLVNPMSGEGIFYAVATGLSAGRAAVSGPPGHAGRRHREAVRTVLDGHLRHTTVASRLASVGAVVDAGIRAAAADPGIFDDLVEIGLGRGRITPALAGGLVRGLAGGLRPFRSGE